jgi:hypothetical protein
MSLAGWRSAPRGCSARPGRSTASRASTVWSAALSFDGDSVCDASADPGVCARLTPSVFRETCCGPTLDETCRSARAARPLLRPCFAFTLGPADAVDPASGDQLFTITLVAGEPVMERWPSRTRFTRDFGLVGTAAASVNHVKR